MDWSTIPLIWRDDNPPPSEHLPLIAEDIRLSLDCLEKPSNLVFHNIWLPTDGDEPSIVISGFSGRDDAFDAGYYPAPPAGAKEEER
jgi:hypothetical protein